MRGGVGATAAHTKSADCVNNVGAAGLSTARGFTTVDADGDKCRKAATLAVIEATHAMEADPADAADRGGLGLAVVGSGRVFIKCAAEATALHGGPEAVATGIEGGAAARPGGSSGMDGHAVSCGAGGSAV